MIIVPTCSCKTTSVVRAELQSWMLGARLQTFLVWVCQACATRHEWSIPQGKTAEEIAWASRRFLGTKNKSRKRASLFKYLLEVPPSERKWIQFGELVTCWREAAGLTIVNATSKAGITHRHWMRIESGETKVRDKTLEAVVRAVGGNIAQAYLLINPKKKWSKKIERRMTRAEKQISKDALITRLHDKAQLQEKTEQDIEIALRELRKVLAAESIEANFLFFALVIHQQYWNKRLGGAVTIEEHKTEIIPLAKEIIDILKRCENRHQRHLIINLLVHEARAYLPKTLILDLVTMFIHDSFTSTMGMEKIQQKLNEFKIQLAPNETLILALFDLVDKQHQVTLLNLCRQLYRYKQAGK